MRFQSALSGYRQVVLKNPLRLKITAESLAKLKKNYNPSNSDWRKLLSDVRKILQEEVDKRFDTETDPDGKPWEKLKQPRPGKILTLTGKLRRSFEFPIRADSSGLMRWVNIIIKTDVPYAKFHQEGTKKMVARPFLGFSPRMWLRIDRTIRDFERKMRMR